MSSAKDGDFTASLGNLFRWRRAGAQPRSSPYITTTSGSNFLALFLRGKVRVGMWDAMSFGKEGDTSTQRQFLCKEKRSESSPT